jgi:hypothetical protein
MRAGLPIEIRREDWKNAAIRTCNLSDLELALGEMAAAKRNAEQSVHFADRSGVAFLRMACRTTLADARHQSGARPDAFTLFREAESIHAQGEPQYPLLYSLWGFRYCDLLLGDAERAAWATSLASGLAATERPNLGPQLDTLREVKQRARTIFQWRTLPAWNPAVDALLDIALDRLALPGHSGGFAIRSGP